MSNDLSANMRRMKLDREHDERRRRMLLDKVAERHRHELAGWLKALEPATYLIRDLEAAYNEARPTPTESEKEKKDD